MALTQTHFRFRNDDGSETTATWLAGVDSSVEFSDANTDFRLRIAVEGSSFGDDSDFKLQYSLNGGSYTDITTSSSVIRALASANFADGDGTTQQITSGDFVIGEMDEDGATGVIAMGVDSTEVESSLRMLAADVADGDTITFRLVDGLGTLLGTYSATPQIQVGTPAVPSLPPNPPVPEQHLVSLWRDLRSGKGGHLAEIAEPFYFESEALTVDKFQPVYEDVVRRRQWRPEGIYAYTEVPVPADVVEHGWEFAMPQMQRRWRDQSARLYGAFLVPQLQDPLTLSYITIIGTTKIVPTYRRGLNGVRPTYAGESGLNLEGE